MSAAQELHDLGFKFERLENSLMFFTAHGSNQNDSVMLSLDVENEATTIIYTFNDPEREPLVATFNRWHTGVAKLLEWWVR